MKKSVLAGWLMALVLLCVSSCGGKEKKAALGASKGLPSELLLIVDRSLWNSTARDSLEDVLKGSVPGLSQNEPMFRMIRLFRDDYSEQYSTLRNIMEVRKDSRLEAVKMGVARNVKAIPQVYVSIAAPDVESLNHFLMENREMITGLFVDSELQREMGLLNKKYSKPVDNAMRQTFAWTVKVPSDIAKVKKAEDFVWASTDRLEQDLNFVCYSLPLGEKLSEERWVALRDSAMKRNIPGSKPDQWMTTAVEDGKPLVMQRPARLADNRVVQELRGLWEMRRGAIGGPFVSLAYPDSAQDRTLVVEGFVYSPNTNKRDLVRRMEAALRTAAPVGR